MLRWRVRLRSSAAMPRSRKPGFGNVYLFNYACQEDVPYNSFEGYQKYTAGLKYPYLADLWDPMARMFFGACSAFKPQPREDWQQPVVEPDLNSIHWWLL